MIPTSPGAPTCRRPALLSVALRWRVGAALAWCLVVVLALPAGPLAAQTPPTNDRFANAPTLGVPDVAIVDTNDATVSPWEPLPACGAPGPEVIRRTVWYRVVPPGELLQISTAGSGTSFRPIIALYQGEAVDALVPIACGEAWELSAPVTAGQTYYLQVGAVAVFDTADAGTLTLVVGPVPATAGGSTPPPPPTNQPPTVNAGPDQTVSLPASAQLTGQAGDDGLPSGVLATTWSMVSGPGTVSFANPNALSTTATFSQPGGYVLRLTASDSAASVSDDLAVTVNPAPTANTVCQPRPNVGVFVRQVGPGRLEVTIRAQTNANTPANALQGVRIASVTNAAIELPNGAQLGSAGGDLPLTAGTQDTQFVVRRAAPGPFRADLVVNDGCGPWPTFAGGGANVP